jgi:hypothetical protein
MFGIFGESLGEKFYLVLVALRADAVAKASASPCSDIGIDAFPVIRPVPDFLAVGTHRDEIL